MPIDFAAFLVASVLIELTPGPNMVTLAIVSAVRGRLTGFAMVAGVGAGLALVAIAAALGLAALVAASPTAFQFLRWGGIAVMLWLAWDAWRDAAEPVTDEEAVRGGLAAHFRLGFLLNVLNPKAAVFYIAVLPGFMARPSLSATLLLSAIYVAIATLIHAAIVAFAGSTRALMIEHPRIARVIRRVLALSLVGVAVWLFWSTRPA